MQLDIETYCAGDYDFPSAARAADRIIAIALADSTGWEHVISGQALAEPEMLREFVRIVRERDPDVIEGHNLFRFDLEYIEARARRHKVPLTLGRGGEPLRGHASRMQVAERAIAYRKYEIVGRHILDTWILAQHYDVTARELEGYGLKEIARHFGVAAPDRTYLRADKISAIFDAEPETVFRYALDDVREVRALSAILSQSYFVQAQIFPFSYQNVDPAGERHPDRRTADPRVPAAAASDSRPRTGPGGAGRPHRDRVPGGRAPGPALRRDLPLPVGDARLRVRSSAGQPGRVPGAPPRPPGLPGGGQAPGAGGGDGRDPGALRGPPDDLQDPDQLVLRLPRLPHGPLQRLHGGQPGDGQGAGADPGGDGLAPGPGGPGDRGGYRRALFRGARGRPIGRGRGAPARRTGGDPAGGDRAGAGRPLPGHVQLQDEELRAPRRRRPPDDHRVGAAIARAGAVPARVDGGDVPPPPAGRAAENPGADAAVRRGLRAAHASMSGPS